MNKEAKVYEVSRRNKYRYLVQDEDENEEEVQYARHQQYVSPVQVLSHICIPVICVGVVALLVLATYLGYVAKTPHPGAAQVHTPCGTYSGTHKNGAYSFKGLRYAAPPVGNLRWAPPVAPECNSEAVHDATQFGNMCAQITLLTNSVTVVGAEDCLFLNVWTPSLRPKTPLPVMFWIHGGSLVGGSGDLPGYSPSEQLAADTELVYVSLNYRLNAFGFLALETLRDGSATNTSGNYGFMDQILALQWVQKNIHLFGGDPKRVTIFGQSSGGTSVWAMMMSPLAKGLFSAVVDMSGSYVFKATLEEAETDNLVFLNKTGCKDAACLHGLSTEQVLEAAPWHEFPGWAYEDAMELPVRSMRHGPLAVVDGHVLPDAPFSMWEKGGGDYSDVPFVVGTTEQEVDFLPSPQNITDWTWDDYDWDVTEKLSTFNESLPKQALELYPHSSFCPVTTRCPERAYTTMISDIRGTCPNHDLAKRAAAALHSPVYRYVVTYTPSHAINATGLLPFPSRFAFHGLDSFAFFEGLEALLGTPLPEQDQHFQELVTQHLVYFAKNGKMVDEWPTFPSSLALLSEKLEVVKADSPIVSRCELWEKNGLYDYAWIN